MMWLHIFHLNASFKFVCNTNNPLSLFFPLKNSKIDSVEVKVQTKSLETFRVGLGIVTLILQ